MVIFFLQIKELLLVGLYVTTHYGDFFLIEFLKDFFLSLLIGICWCQVVVVAIVSCLSSTAPPVLLLSF